MNVPDQDPSLKNETFVAGLKNRWERGSKEEARGGETEEGIAWELIVQAVEAVHGGRWEEFRDQHGDWGRDLAL